MTPPEPLPPHRWTVGDLTIAAVHEQELPPATGAWLMPDLTGGDVAQADDLAPEHIRADRTLRLDSHSYAFVVDGRTVVVDTGVGNGKARDNPAWNDLRTDYLGHLSRAGFDPGTVDLVVLTHLHTDHVGWNTRWDGSSWVPTFPHARHVVASTEWRYWRGAELEPARAAMFADSVQPVADAGLLDAVDVPDDGVELAEGLWLHPAPGHTPGQVTVHVGSAGERAVITGDAVHHPIQVARPELTTRADVDPQLTVATRRRLLAGFARERTLVLGTHFAGGSAGHVEVRGDGYRFRPARG